MTKCVSTGNKALGLSLESQHTTRTVHVNTANNVSSSKKKDI